MIGRFLDENHFLYDDCPDEPMDDSKIKYILTVEVETDGIIGTKEQIAMLLEWIGKVTFTDVKKTEDDEWRQSEHTQTQSAN